MFNSRARHVWLFFLAATLLVPVGCADGPIPYVNSLSPWRRQEWLADEQYEPTLHRQLDEITTVRDTAASMTAAEQAHWAAEMKYLLQTQETPLMRATAVNALAALAVPEADAGLRLALKDKDTSVRVAACRAWSRHGGREAIERLAEASAAIPTWMSVWQPPEDSGDFANRPLLKPSAWHWTIPIQHSNIGP